MGILCIVGGVWLTLATETRTRSLYGSTETQASSSPSALGAAQERPRASKTDTAQDARKSARYPGAVRASVGGATPRHAASAIPAGREERVAAARRELELLSVQKPENFLAVFDMMKQENRWDDKVLEGARAASHGYILARTRVLEGMLRRFIDDPDGDRGLETDALAHLDDEFKQRIDSLARDIPALTNLQEILTTTTLKAPTFAEIERDTE
jgi:predicted transcriptional regulator